VLLTVRTFLLFAQSILCRHSCIFVLAQVLAFDTFDRRLRALLVDVFQKHGIPLGGGGDGSGITPEVPLVLSRL
jgi:hypothetical protein